MSAIRTPNPKKTPRLIEPLLTHREAAIYLAVIVALELLLEILAKIGQ